MKTQDENIADMNVSLNGDQFTNRIPSQAILRMISALSKALTVERLRILALRECNHKPSLKDSKPFEVFLAVGKGDYYAFYYEQLDGKVYNTSISARAYALDEYVFSFSECVIYLNN